MGAYLSQANLTKESHDGENESFSFGASSMQGWRLGMEDAHVAVLNLDAETAFFAVYDGHGGQEVARYCAKHLHNEMLESEAYRNGDIGSAITGAYLRMDYLMKEDGGREELSTMTRAATSGRESSRGPYATPSVELTSNAATCEKVEDTPSLKSNKRNRSGQEEGTGEGHVDNGETRVKKGALDSDMGQKELEEEEKEEEEEEEESSGSSEPSPSPTRESPGVAAGESRETRETNAQNAKPQGGNVGGKEEESLSGISESESSKQRRVVPPKVEYEEDEDDDDDPPYALGDEDDDDLWQPDEVQPQLRSRKYIGPTAGCTAVSAIVQGAELLVANAGDSRCVMSRGGKVLELSRDHKPQLADEYERIRLAGGHVSEDGRVNGCLNLSRAIGDMEYKQSEELPPQGQMVTAVPELAKIQLQAGDEFLVLACDGIWDVMSSQQVVDFVRERLHNRFINGKRLSTICEELFEKCVAPSKGGNGLGMDNMSAIIVVLKGYVRG